MKSVFVITLGDVIGMCVFALIVTIAIVLGLRMLIRQTLCKHADFYPPATSFGSGGHGWECKRCGKDFGWGEKPPTSYGEHHG